MIHKSFPFAPFSLLSLALALFLGLQVYAQDPAEEAPEVLPAVPPEVVSTNSTESVTVKPPVDERESAYKNIELLTTVMEIIRKDYVDGQKLTYQDLTYGALKGMLNNLDPHSQFMEPVNYDEMKQETGGQFGGIGVVIGMKDGIITIISPIEDTPGFRAGLLPGDKVIRIDGKSTDKITLPEAVKQLRGQPGTKLNITILRPKSNEIKEIELTRASIKVESVKDVKMLDDKIGYVRMTQFNEPTADEFEKALVKLEKQGMQGLVLDLRNNPGGLLESAVDVAGKFLPKGELVVSTEGRNPAVKNVYRVRESKTHPAYPIVVLINEGSASGSEIVAGALQDTQRAVIVGETSFGKGSVQSVMPLRDGSAVRLTTAKYYTPSRKVIHEHGITPDIIVSMTEEEWAQVLLQRSQSRFDELGKNDDKETVEGETKTPPEKKEEVRDVQLDRAVDSLKGTIIYFQRSGKAALKK
jgi:carboxyl-terminal processing protease